MTDGTGPVRIHQKYRRVNQIKETIAKLIGALEPLSGGNVDIKDLPEICYHLRNGWPEHFVDTLPKKDRIIGFHNLKIQKGKGLLLFKGERRQTEDSDVLPAKNA